MWITEGQIRPTHRADNGASDIWCFERALETVIFNRALGKVDRTLDVMGELLTRRCKRVKSNRGAPGVMT